jgi:quinol monooxygenase YgiN
MSYLRLSIARPRRGEEQRVHELQGEIAKWVVTQPGCRASYLLHPHDDSGEIARVTIYESEEAADRTASHAHMMALRSQLNLAIEADHVERGFHAEAEYSA